MRSVVSPRKKQRSPGASASRGPPPCPPSPPAATRRAAGSRRAPRRWSGSAPSSRRRAGSRRPTGRATPPKCDPGPLIGTPPCGRFAHRLRLRARCPAPRGRRGRPAGARTLPSSTTRARSGSRTATPSTSTCAPSLQPVAASRHLGACAVRDHVALVHPSLVRIDVGAHPQPLRAALEHGRRLAQHQLGHLLRAQGSIGMDGRHRGAADDDMGGQARGFGAERQALAAGGICGVGIARPRHFAHCVTPWNVQIRQMNVPHVVQG